ncbi:MAG TPA: hypothetical protein PLV25_00345 [Opitutales bacterium]|nr:hypothetical protein [Opitutales bacterium]
MTTPTPDAFDRKLLKPLPKVEAPPPPPDVPFPPPPEAKLLKVQVGSMDPDNLQNQPQPIIVPPASPYGYPAAAPAYPGGWNPQGALMYLQQPIPGGGSSTSGSGLILPFQAPMVPPAPEPVHSGASYTEH